MRPSALAMFITSTNWANETSTRLTSQSVNLRCEKQPLISSPLTNNKAKLVRKRMQCTRISFNDHQG